MRLLFRPITRIVALASFVALLGGCGWLIDKDRIQVAKVKDQYITRGDLDRVIRNMPDDERPIIQNKGDLQRVLRSHIEETIKQDLATQLEGDKKISVPRELAAQQFDAMNPEFKNIDQMVRPEDFNLTPYDLKVMKEEREIGIDKLHRKMLGDAAVGYRIREAFEKKQLSVTPEELNDEYTMRKDELHNLEITTFSAIRFVGDMEQARAQAAQVVQRIKEGEQFETIAAQYAAANPDSFVAAATIENNPNVPKFKGMWQQMHGAEAGEVIGPVFMPPSDKVNPQTGQAEVMEGAVVVLKVLEHKPETTMTVEQAADMLAAPILYAKMIDMLFKEYGVEIYEDRLPDPSFMNDPNSAFATG